MWPLGYQIDEKGSDRNDKLQHAAVAFAQAYITSSLRHIRKKPDPLIELIGALGYSLTHWSEDETDAFTEEVDDLYMALTMLIDPIVEEMLPHLENREISFEYPANSEDLLVHIHGDVILERYRALLHQVKKMTPPKVVNELADLDPVGEYIDHCVNEVFKNIHQPTVRHEVKLMFIEAVKRH